MCEADLVKVVKKERGKGPKLLGLGLWVAFVRRLAFLARPDGSADPTLTAAPDQSHSDQFRNKTKMANIY